MSLPAKRVKILLHGEPYHTQVFEEQLKENCSEGFDTKYYAKLTKEINYEEFDIFHLISAPLPTLRQLAGYKKILFYHWIGTDVYRIISDSPIKSWFKKRILKSTKTTNIVVAQPLQKELEQIDITSTILPLVKLNFIDDCPPLPQKFSVLTYVPHDRWSFYNGDLILQLAEKFTDIDFHVITGGNKSDKQQNVFTYEFMKNINSFYVNNSALLRFTKHDGLPKMVLEALSYGRHVLWNNPFPNCHLVKNIEDCVNVINQLQTNPSINKTGKEYVESVFRPNKIIDDYLDLCNKVIGNK